MPAPAGCVSAALQGADDQEPGCWSAKLVESHMGSPIHVPQMCPKCFQSARREFWGNPSVMSFPRLVSWGRG